MTASTIGSTLESPLAPAGAASRKRALRGVFPKRPSSARALLRCLLLPVGIAVVLGAVAIASTWTETAPAVVPSGVVVIASGAAPVKVGDACQVRLDPETRAGLNCRVTVTCAGKALFGGALPGGYAACAVEGGLYTSAVDAFPSSKDGDPAVEVRLSENLAQVTEGPAGKAVQIELQP